MVFLVVPVKVYEGARPAERPIEFVFDDETFKVVEIIDRWYEGNQVAGRPNYTYFKVLTHTGKTFILRYNQRHEVWSVLIN